MFETLPTGGKQHRVAVREWWGTVSEVLKDIQNVTDLDDPRHLPYELFAMLAGQAAYLAVGQIPDPIKHVGGKGRTAPGPSETSDIRWAVTYVHAVREGLFGASSRPPVGAASRRPVRLPLPLCVGCTSFATSELCVNGAEHTSLFRIQKRGPCRLSGTVWQTQLVSIA